MLEKGQIPRYHIFNSVINAPQEIKKFLRLEDVRSFVILNYTSPSKPIYKLLPYF